MSHKEFNIQEILYKYNLGKLVHNELATQGKVQTVYIIDTVKGKYILKHYNRSKESVLFEVEVLQKLEEHHYPCLKLCEDELGNIVGELNDKPYTIYEYVEGEHIEHPNQYQLSELIRKIAELHNITRAFKPSKTDYRINYNIAQCKQLVEEKSDNLNSDNAKRKKEWYFKEVDRLELPKSIPQGICHGDFHFSNILYQDGKFNCLIDYDDANYTYLLFDITSVVDPFKNDFDWDTWEKFTPDDDVFDFSELRETITEYSAVRQLEENEKQHLFDVYKLSILIDCIWYFERGNTNDFFEKRKIDYLDHLGRDKFYYEVFQK